MKSAILFRREFNVTREEGRYGMSPNVDRALGRARIPSDMVSAIMTGLVSFGINFEERP
jgi:hypothetical protein